MKSRSVKTASFYLTFVLLFAFATSLQGYAATPITMWIASQPTAVSQWVPTFVDSFNKANPGIELKVEIYPFVSGIRTKLILAVASGTAPDIFYDSSNLVSKWAYSGIALPIDKYLNTWSGKKDVIPDILRSVVYQGKTYAFPFSFWPIGDVYNLDILENNGLVEPKTWSDMINSARKLFKVNDNGDVAVYGYYTAIDSGEMALTDLELALNQLGTTMLPPESKTASLNTDAGRQALAYLLNAREAGMGNKAGLTPNIAAGGVAIWHYYGGYDFLNKVVNLAPDVKWGFRRYVGPTTNKSTIQINAGNLMITTASKHPDEAWKVIESFAAPEHLMGYLQAHSSSLPTRLSQVYDKRLQKGEAFNQLLAAVTTPMTTLGPMHPYYTDIRKAAGDVIVKAVLGVEAPSAVLEEAERLMNVNIAELMAANK